MPGNCQSCNLDLSSGSRRGVPSFIDCCRHCWLKVPVHERLRLSIAVRDRQPGGIFNEVACAASSFLEMQQELDS